MIFPLAYMLAVFAEFEPDILRDRVKAGIAQAPKAGRPHGRPPTVAKYASPVSALAKKGLNNTAISRRLRISRISVRRFLARPAPCRHGEPVAQESILANEPRDLHYDSMDLL